MHHSAVLVHFVVVVHFKQLFRFIAFFLPKRAALPLLIPLLQRYLFPYQLFVNRNHFIESEWLTNNSDIVQNISQQYGQTDVRTVIIDKKNWFKITHNIDTEYAPETVHLEYLPYKNIHKIQNKETLIVLFITDNQKIRDKIGTDLAVVHMGLLLPGGILRHASSEQKQVVDVNFYEYIERQKQNKNNIGITLVAIK